MDTRFLEAWVNRDDHVLLGHKLRPLCLYDCIAFDAVANPIACLLDAELRENWRIANYEPFAVKGEQGEPPQILQIAALHVLQAALICSAPPGAALAPAFFSLIPSEVEGPLKLPFAHACLALDSYIEDFAAFPATWKNAEADKPLNAPWPLAVALAIDPSPAALHGTLSLPIGQAIWISAVRAEQNGSAEIVSADEVKALAQMGVKL